MDCELARRATSEGKLIDEQHREIDNHADDDSVTECRSIQRRVRLRTEVCE